MILEVINRGTLLRKEIAMDISYTWLLWARDSGLILGSLWGWMQFLPDDPSRAQYMG